MGLVHHNIPVALSSPDSNRDTIDKMETAEVYDDDKVGITSAVQGLFGIDYDRDKSQEFKLSRRYERPLSEYPHAWFAIERPKIHWSWSIILGLIGLLVFSLYIVM